MRPKDNSKTLLAVTRSKAKMYEYDVPLAYHIKMPKNPANLFSLSLGILGDAAVKIWTGRDQDWETQEFFEGLKFSAYFTDAFVQSKLDKDLDPYFVLVGAATYYLCDLQGSAQVLVNRIQNANIELECKGLERLLFWILKGRYNDDLGIQEPPFADLIKEISEQLLNYYKTGAGYDVLELGLEKLRTFSYANGTPRQLLFSDLICAVTKKHYLNSSWHCLPNYSGMTTDDWKGTLEKETFIRNLWPAQHLIGINGVYAGKSAVIQMPTSAGKTRAIELIIRSSFLSGRTTLAVIIAPFRALCNEIKNSLIREFKDEQVSIDEISDVIQKDFQIEDFLSRKQILIVTPEKLVYVLRQSPELAEKIGLVVYDEGHQFDSGRRGVTYELLLTTLNAMVPRGSQKVLISAVITNANAVSEWLDKDNSKVISGNNLSPTMRTIGFSSWRSALGRLEFVSQSDPEDIEFFVPRVINSFPLQLRGRERRIRQFPEKDDGPSVALFLGLKLVKNGSAAIFCGTKTIANSLCEKVLDSYGRGLALTKPSEISDAGENKRLHFLYQKHFGPDSTQSKSAELGIYTHHRNTPHGIRLAVEHAMKEGLAKFVICTSTLAQGVNIPIRYLIVTSIYQGNKKMKVRDFHNLIGRVGRSGMHTEGSILFADTEIFDKRKTEDEDWRWQGIKEILDSDNSEPCGSSLLAIFEPIVSGNGTTSLPLNLMEFTERYLADTSIIETFSKELFDAYGSYGFELGAIRGKIQEKVEVLSAIESFLLSYFEKGVDGEEGNAKTLAKSTFAYSLASDQRKTELEEIFGRLSENIENNIVDEERKKAFGRTLLGISEISHLEKIVLEKHLTVANEIDLQKMFLALSDLIYLFIKNENFKKCTAPSGMNDFVVGWINGKSYFELFSILKNDGARMRWGTRFRDLKVDDVVDICESGLGFDGMLIVGAIGEIFSLTYPDNEALRIRFRSLQKMIKYGLSKESEIGFFEIGFSDRVIAAELGIRYPGVHSRADAVFGLIENPDAAKQLLDKYPSFYNQVLNNFLS